MTAAALSTPPAERSTGPADGGPGAAHHRRRAMSVLPTVPFFGYVAVFLVVPSIVVVVNAFRAGDGAFSLDNVRGLGQPTVLAAFGQSLALSAVTAIIGAVVGGVAAYALSTGHPNSALRRAITSGCAVLAQFGGVMLAFAFIATVGSTGMVTNLLRTYFSVQSNGGWLYDFPGLVLVYSYFQIPLMVIVFLPAVDGIRPQWREATETLGGSTWVFWRRVAGPLLAPAFVGSALLLFANAFSAYATAAALITQYNTLVPLQIRGALISEVNLGQANLASAMALGMIVVVAVVMSAYAWLGGRSARWLG